MKRVSVEDVEPGTLGSGVDRRALSDPLGATGLALNRYRLAPGEGFPSGLHAHADQEEIFVVFEGEATFETLAPRNGAERESDDAEREGREVVVREGEAIRFAPGEFQSGRNAADRDLVALAIGAPRDSDDVRLPVACSECGRDDVRLETGEDGVRFVCPDCGAERVPAPCPECGGEEMRLALDEAGQIVAACEDCEAEFERPPVRE